MTTLARDTILIAVPTLQKQDPHHLVSCCASAFWFLQAETIQSIPESCDADDAKVALGVAYQSFSSEASIGHSESHCRARSDAADTARFTFFHTFTALCAASAASVFAADLGPGKVAGAGGVHSH